MATVAEVGGASYVKTNLCSKKFISVVVSTQLKRNSNVTIIGVFVLKGLVIAEKISPRTHFPLPTSATNKKHAQGPAKPKPPRDVRPKPPGFGKKKTSSHIER